MNAGGGGGGGTMVYVITTTDEKQLEMFLGQDVLPSREFGFSQVTPAAHPQDWGGLQTERSTRTAITLVTLSGV